MLQTGRGKSLAGRTTWQRFGNREQPQGSEVQESFLLPSKAAQVPPSCWVGRLEVEKAIEHWEGEPVARNGDGDTGDSLTSSHQASLQVPMALQSLFGLCPLPWLYSLSQVWGTRLKGTTEGTSASIPSLSQGQPSSAPCQGWGPHEDLSGVGSPADARGSPGICLAA